MQLEEYISWFPLAGVSLAVVFLAGLPAAFLSDKHKLLAQALFSVSVAGICGVLFFFAADFINAANHFKQEAAKVNFFYKIPADAALEGRILWDASFDTGEFVPFGSSYTETTGGLDRADYVLRYNPDSTVDVFQAVSEDRLVKLEEGGIREDAPADN